MKRKLLMVLISLMLMLTIVGCGKAVDDATAKQYSSQAEAVVGLLIAGDYSSLTAQFDEQMKIQLTEDKLAQIKPIIEAAGKYIGVKKSTVQTKDDIIVAVSVVQFENKTHIVTVSYNSNNEIAGLFIQ